MMGIVISILSALVISLLGSASLFLVIGSLEYLSTFMPMWKAWDIMGLTSGVIGGLLFLVLFFDHQKGVEVPLSVQQWIPVMKR
jgi:hypothetical protein